MTKCQHATFSATVEVNRLSREEGGPITHYDADVKIRCVECDRDFEFVGLPIGYSAYVPTTGIDRLTLSAPDEDDRGDDRQDTALE